MFSSQGGKGDAEYLAAFQQIVMPIAYEVLHWNGFVNKLFKN